MTRIATLTGPRAALMWIALDMVGAILASSLFIQIVEAVR